MSIALDYDRVVTRPGKHTKKLLNMVIYSGFTHQKRWFSIAMLNYQRVMGKWCLRPFHSPFHDSPFHVSKNTNAARNIKTTMVFFPTQFGLELGNFMFFLVASLGLVDFGCCTESIDKHWGKCRRKAHLFDGCPLFACPKTHPLAHLNTIEILVLCITTFFVESYERDHIPCKTSQMHYSGLDVLVFCWIQEVCFYSTFPWLCWRISTLRSRNQARWRKPNCLIIFMIQPPILLGKIITF